MAETNLPTIEELRSSGVTIQWTDPDDSYWLNDFCSAYQKVADKEWNDPTNIVDEQFPSVDAFTVLADYHSGVFTVEELSLEDFIVEQKEEYYDRTNELLLQVHTFGSLPRPLILKGDKVWAFEGKPCYYQVFSNGVFEFCEKLGIPCECLCIPFEKYRTVHEDTSENSEPTASE